MTTSIIEQLPTILAEHGAWLRGEEHGRRANLRGANLQCANLQCAVIGEGATVTRDPFKLVVSNSVSQSGTGICG